MATPPVQVFGDRYEAVSLIARGGMAEVWLAHDTLLDRLVALKALFPELSVDPNFVERFRREAQAAANLSHPNIVSVYDWGEVGGTYFIVMEYVEGRALSAVVREEGPLLPDRSASIGADVAAALGFAHRNGVIHRDVKPGNVLITADDHVRVTDFGIARASSTEDHLTQTGAVMGTATYFSPEQAQGLAVDQRSDVYSLGVVLFEMVTGRPPFVADSPVATAYKHVHEDPRSPRDLIPDIPVPFAAIVLQALAKDLHDRYASAEELRADLLRFCQGRPVLADPPLRGGGGLGAARARPDGGGRPGTAPLRGLRGAGERRAPGGAAFAGRQAAGAVGKEVGGASALGAVGAVGAAAGWGEGPGGAVAGGIAGAGVSGPVGGAIGAGTAAGGGGPVRRDGGTGGLATGRAGVQPTEGRGGHSSPGGGGGVVASAPQAGQRRYPDATRPPVAAGSQPGWEDPAAGRGGPGSGVPAWSPSRRSDVPGPPIRGARLSSTWIYGVLLAVLLVALVIVLALIGRQLDVFGATGAGSVPPKKAAASGVVVPTDIVGKPFADAAAEIHTLGIGVRRVDVVDSSKPRDTVVNTKPAPGEQVQPAGILELDVAGGGGGALISEPDVIGLDVASATQQLKEHGFTVGSQQQRSSATVAAGQVLDTNPPFGSQGHAGDSVNLIVSSGKGTVVIPDETSKSQDTATTDLTQAGFRVVVGGAQASVTIPAGSVVSTTPAANSPALQGSTVILSLSSGPAKVRVPYVLNFTEANARADIQAKGLIVAETTQPVANADKEGRVIDESPGAGVTVDQGSTVAITVGQLGGTAPSASPGGR